MQWWLNNDLAEWERVISALRTMKEPVLADAVAVVCKCESLHESPTEESQKGDKNIRKIKLLDAKLKEVEKRFQLLDKEWERGENEWRDGIEKSERSLGRSCQKSANRKSIPHSWN